MSNLMLHPLQLQACYQVIKDYALWLPKTKMHVFILYRNLDSQIKDFKFNYVFAMLHMPIDVTPLRYFNISTLVYPCSKRKWIPNDYHLDSITNGKLNKSQASV